MELEPLGAFDLRVSSRDAINDIGAIGTATELLPSPRFQVAQVSEELCPFTLGSR